MFSPLLFSAAVTQTVDSSLATQRAKQLQHGINLREWFAQVYDSKAYTKEHFETWNTPQDIALIKSIGFDHVRLSVMWDYSGGFGAVIKKDGVATVDELTVKALGP